METMSMKRSAVSSFLAQANRGIATMHAAKKARMSVWRVLTACNGLSLGVPAGSGSFTRLLGRPPMLTCDD